MAMSVWLLECNQYPDDSESCDETMGIFSSKDAGKQAVVEKQINVTWLPVEGYSTEQGESINSEGRHWDWWLTEWQIDQIVL